MTTATITLEGSTEIGATVEATAVARLGLRKVAGRIRFQGCTENSCLPPAEHAFGVALDVE